MTLPTYDEIRAAAVPCAGGCKVLVTHGHWCHTCLPKLARFLRGRLWASAIDDRLRRGQPDAYGGME